MGGEKIAIVLGNFVTPKGNIDLIGKRRVEGAVELYKKGRVSKIIFTGGINRNAMGEAKSVTEAEAMKAYAKTLGIPEDACILEARARHTVGNAEFVAKILERMNPSKVYLVTSIPHDERAGQIFLDRGFSKWNLEVVKVKIIAKRKREIPSALAWRGLTWAKERIRRKQNRRR